MNDIINQIESIVELEAVEKARSRKDFSAYNYNGIPVPRVTKIIDAMSNKDYLLKYACDLTWYGYLREKDLVTSIGTHVHEAVEKFLLTGKDPELDFGKMPKQAYIIERAFNNFKVWYYDLLSHGNTIEILGTEIPVITPYYAGTLDILAKINGQVYILDIKTSKKISSEHLLQTAAYMYGVNTYGLEKFPGIHINGIGIIRVDKESKGLYEDLFLNEYNMNQTNIINYYVQGFLSILNAYYNKINIEYQFSQYKKNYPGLNNVINNLIEGE